MTFGSERDYNSATLDVHGSMRLKLGTTNVKPSKKVKLQVYVTAKQYELLSQEAVQYDIRISELIRRIVSSHYTGPQQ